MSNTEYIDEAQEMLAGEDVVRYRKQKSAVEQTGYTKAWHALTFWNELSAEAYRVYLAYCSFADLSSKSETFVSVSRLAKMLRMSEPTLKRARSELVALKLIAIEFRGFGKTRNVVVEDVDTHKVLNEIATTLLEARRNKSIEIRNDPPLRSEMIPSKGSEMIPLNKNKYEEEQVEEDSPALSGRDFSFATGSGSRSKKAVYADDEIERVEVGHENDDPRDDASPQNPLEHLIASLSNGYKFSKTSRRKLTDPVSVLQNGNPVLEPSPVEEMQAYPEEFSKWVKGQAVFLRNHGGCTVSKLCNMVTKYETATYGWLAVRPTNYDAHDPNAPWN